MHKELIELKYNYYALRRSCGPLIADCAAGVLSTEEAASLMGIPIEEAQERTEEANQLARKLLADYRNRGRH